MKPLKLEGTEPSELLGSCCKGCEAESCIRGDDDEDRCYSDSYTIGRDSSLHGPGFLKTEPSLDVTMTDEAGVKTDLIGHETQVENAQQTQSPSGSGGCGSDLETEPSLDKTDSETGEEGSMECCGDYDYDLGAVPYAIPFVLLPTPAHDVFRACLLQGNADDAAGPADNQCLDDDLDTGSRDGDTQVESEFDSGDSQGVDCRRSPPSLSEDSEDETNDSDQSFVTVGGDDAAPPPPPCPGRVFQVELKPMPRLIDLTGVTDEDEDMRPCGDEDLSDRQPSLAGVLQQVQLNF